MVGDVAVAEIPVGATGIGGGSAGVVADAEEDWALSPLELKADTL